MLFPEPVGFSAPTGFSEAVRALARRNHMSRSEYLRRSVFEKMEREGFRLAVVPSSHQSGENS